jgi:hypothetical protein
MKAQDFVAEVERTFVGSKYNIDDETRANIKECLFDRLVSDMGNILATRVNKVFKDQLINRSTSSLMIEIGANCIGAFLIHLGPILNEVNLKAEKINKLGKYGFPDEWFRHSFIKEVRNYTELNSETSWRYFFPGCKEIIYTNLRSFEAVKEFLNP